MPVTIAVIKSTIRLPESWQFVMLYYVFMFLFLKGGHMSNKFDSLMIILNKLDRNETVTVHSL